MSVFITARRSSAIAVTDTLLVFTTIESYGVCVWYMKGYQLLMMKPYLLYVMYLIIPY